jgi:hypothetical protein
MHLAVCWSKKNSCCDPNLVLVFIGTVSPQMHRFFRFFPISHIASICELPPQHLRRVLKIKNVLNLGKNISLDFLDGEAADYVNTDCAHLEIPFSVAQQAERILDRREIKWAFFGHRPHLLAAAVIETVLRTRGERSRIKDLCGELECGESSVKRIMAKIPVNLCYE